MNKTLKIILSVAAAVTAVAGAVVLVAHFWDRITALCPCKKSHSCESDFVDDILAE